MAAPLVPLQHLFSTSQLTCCLERLTWDAEDWGRGAQLDDKVPVHPGDFFSKTDSCRKCRCDSSLGRTRGAIRILMTHPQEAATC